MKPYKYPSNIHSWKTKIAYRAFKWLYVFEKGKGSVIGRVTGMGTELGILYLVLDRLGIPITWRSIILFVVFGIMLCYVLGHFYMKYNLDLMQNQIGSERNPLWKDIYDKVVGKGGKKL